MRPSIDPSELSPDQRRSELARILAAGVLRLRKLRLLARQPTAAPWGSSAKSHAERLDVPVGTVLSVRNGLTADEAK